jgi:hypothetical protein
MSFTTAEQKKTQTTWKIFNGIMGPLALILLGIGFTTAGHEVGLKAKDKQITKAMYLIHASLDDPKNQTKQREAREYIRHSDRLGAETIEEIFLIAIEAKSTTD